MTARKRGTGQPLMWVEPMIRGPESAVVCTILEVQRSWARSDRTRADDLRAKEVIGTAVRWLISFVTV